MRQGIVSIYLAMLLRNEPLVVKGPLDRVRDFVYIDDCVSAWKRALERDVTGPLNIGTGVGTSVRDLIDKLLSAAGIAADHPIVSGERTPGDQTALIADPSRAQAELGWTPATDIDAGLARTVAWARGD